MDVAGLQAGWIPSLVVLAAVLGTDFWVYADARERQDRGRPVVLWLGNLRVSTPGQWLLACLVMWVVFLPAYLVGRSSAG
jgi:hypothetical protein